MKKSFKMQILLFCLIPIGIVLLVLSIKIVRKTFSGNIITEIPFTMKSSEFVLEHTGHYSIWHKGQYFRRAPLTEYKPVITNLSDGQKLRLHSSIFRPNANNGKTARMELFRFSAPQGKYLLELAEGKSITRLEDRVIKLIPAKDAEYDEYFIQVRETRSMFTTIAAIAAIVLSALLIIGGLVGGILAGQFFNEPT